MHSEEIFKRYSRQIILREFGIEAQQKLSEAKVLVAGAGGLGCPALLYLAAAGIGTLGIVDYDIVEISNLHRQTLYETNDAGLSKSAVAASKLNSFNPDIKITPFDIKLDNQNALQVISDFDVIIDGTDNFESRYLINDACVLLGKPLIYGAVFRFEGQAGVFNMPDKVSGLRTNYRDLFPEPPDPASHSDCNDAGVLGVVPGIIGTIQAAETIKIIAGIGETLCNEIISYNMLTNNFHKFKIQQSDRSEYYIPKTESEFMNFDYISFCGKQESDNEISVEEFEDLISENNTTIIDVREKNEMYSSGEIKSEHIPLSIFKEKILSADFKDKIVLICQTGIRSLIAVEIFKEISGGAKVYSLSGGIDAWERHCKKI